MTNRHIGGDSFGISRRAVLAGGGGLALAALVAGCTDTTQAAGPAVKTSVGPSSFKLPNTSIPKGATKITWVDSGDLKANYWTPMFTAYQKKHPNVSANYKGTNWNTIQQSVTLGLENGTAPDVFQLPGGVTIGQAIQHGWVIPFEDVVPDLAHLMKPYPPGTVVNGINRFGGKTYQLSPTSQVRLVTAQLYNSDLIGPSGFDPGNPISWDDFRAMLRKVTKKGAGQYYGIIAGLAQGGQLSGPVGDMGRLAGAHIGNAYGGALMNFTTGEYTYADPALVAAMELFLAIKADGSFFPGSVSLDAPGARGRFPQGSAAVILQGAWNIRPWQHDNPSLKLAVGLPPRENPRSKHMLSYVPGGSNNYVINAKTAAKDAIGDIWSYTMSKAGQTLWAELDGVGDPAAYPGVYAKASLSALEKREQKLASANMVVAPEPAARNTDVNMVYKNLKPVTPSFSDVCVGLFTGQLSDVKAQFQKVSDASNRALDDAIAAAQKQGAKVSRADWVFSGWDPDKPYTKFYTGA